MAYGFMFGVGLLLALWLFLSERGQVVLATSIKMIGLISAITALSLIGAFVWYDHVGIATTSASISGPCSDRLGSSTSS